MTAKNQLIKLAKMQDPEPELYEIPYSGLEWIKEKIYELVLVENDDQFYSIMMRLMSHIMIVEDWVRAQEIKKTEILCEIPPITSYKQHQMGMQLVYA